MQLELPQKIESERECGCTCAILPPNQYPPPKNHWTSNQATLHEGISGFRWIFQRAEEILQTQTCSKDDIFEPLKLSALHLLANWNWEGGVLGTNGTWPWKNSMNKSLPCMTHKKLISFLRRCQWFFGHFHSKNFGHLCFFFSSSFHSLLLKHMEGSTITPLKTKMTLEHPPFSIGNTVHLQVGYIVIYWLVVSTPLKNISQNRNLPKVGVKIKKYSKPPPSIVLVTITTPKDISSFGFPKIL